MREIIRLFGTSPNIGSAKTRKRLNAFKENEEGTIVIFAVFMVLMILLVAGIGIDLMRSERDRTVLQHTLDRAILAAADLDQEQDPQTVVNDYFETAGLESFLSNVTVDKGLNYKTVSAEAESITTTAFMKAAGVETLSAAASGEAEERVSKVEISMVLDVSGSMGWNDRMTRLKDASREFIDTVLDQSTQGMISVSLVPYDEQVSLGRNLYESLQGELDVNHMHNYSHCIEFPNSDFENTGLDWNETYNQMQHTRMYWHWEFQCSTNAHDGIAIMSQDAQALKDQVDQLQPSGATHVFMGMKWAAALLDPGFNVVVDDLIGDQHIDAEFSGRPASFDDPETLKTIILMTDGENTSSYRVFDWAYSNPSHYVHWNNWGIKNYLDRYVSSYQHGNYYYWKYNSSMGDALLENICDAAKDEGIVIWSIGFEISDHGANVIQDCASSPSHFFRVEGVEISEAFDAIARQINQLRLTQ